MTIPYPALDPVDEMDAAMAHLRLLQSTAMADDSDIIRLRASDAIYAITAILDTLDPIRDFLADNDFSTVQFKFEECRRQSIARKSRP